MTFAGVQPSPPDNLFVIHFGTSKTSKPARKSRHWTVGKEITATLASGSTTTREDDKLNYRQAKKEIETTARQDWDANAKLRAEFSHNFDSYLAYRAADSTGHIKIMKDQVRA